LGALLFICIEPCRSHPDPLENIKIYTYVISTSPENVYAYLNRGISYRMVSDFDNALVDFNKAEELGGTGRFLWLNRAMTQVYLKNFELALADMDRILEKEPEDSSAWFYRGEILYRLKDYEGAIECYTKSLGVQEAAHVLFVRGDAYSMLGDYEKALMDYTSAHKKRPYTIGFLIARSKCLAKMDRFEEARADLNEAAKKQPERYQVYLERAILSASQTLEASKTADLKKALQYLEDELFFRPRDSKVFSDRARVYEMMGDLDKAKEDLDRAMEYADYTDPAYLRMRAKFLDRLGEKEAAEADRAVALEVESRPPPTATPLPGPTLSMEEIMAQPTPNYLPGLAP
jgi:tetratricopeptide (TPR) repeat protein